MMGQEVARKFGDRDADTESTRNILLHLSFPLCSFLHPLPAETEEIYLFHSITGPEFQGTADLAYRHDDSFYG